MSLPLDLIADLHLSDLAAEPLWPSALVAGAAHYADAEPREICSPIDGRPLGRYAPATAGLVNHAVEAAHGAFLKWRSVPAPLRGELVRRIGDKVRQRKVALASLVTLEAGKIASEAEGEVQEWIDICDFAVGLSRQLHGLTLACERPAHRMMEQWHPLGAVGVISAFNFPVAVWAWNAMLALVCGDAVVWKPSEKTPLCAIAVQRVIEEAIDEMGEAVPAQVCQLVLGEREAGERIAAHPSLPLVSATGSTRMGRAVAQAVAARLGRSLLELGGNNAMVVSPSADLELALRAIVFSAAGTAGQRCTSLRRLIVHESLIEPLTARLAQAFDSLPVGNPGDEGTLVGPLIDAEAYWAMQQALQAAEQQGGRLVTGGERLAAGDDPRQAFLDQGYYVRPALVRVPGNIDVVREETFAPILYVMPYSELLDAIDLNNGVSQGLSSAIFTDSLREAEAFLGPAGSDCGIANVNIGTSGAEIGGAFGGEKDTGGGRESGSDAWKNYMRRATNTVNYGDALPLAQGVRFEV
ncbi:L-piperidine-6-carboxylate dehydrogenase [Chitinimonas koreensis]|uniref:L-piperidine-6-carboxylate dehydrogenase n=1 Tax=Chitinimonas koreensis TaxID=356302 RepID=UPI00042970F6|nr:aldehyde dehydrogenase family protein [Chitinimonas koreensis]QNM94745.1 aldehyde dehydrogenase family protein [Chitinimonas koreensis]